jgi:hypothetical protein
VPSTAEILAREESRARVVEALRALEEPYRSTLLLRYFEDLPPRAIARREGVPVETVRTRIKRGLECLRARLDREYGGDRGAWGAALLPLARFPRPFGPLAPVIAMSMQVKLSLVAATVLSLVVLLLRGREGIVPGAAPVVISGPVSASLPLAPVKLAPPPSPPARAAVLPPPGAGLEPAEEASGSLLVRVTWSDGTPAPDIRAHVDTEGSAWPSHRVEAVTGPDGTFLLPDVPVGTALVRIDRGENDRARVEPDRQAEVTLQVPRSFDVEGLVLDPEGNPVAAADVWVSVQLSVDDGFVVARTAGDGTFRLRSLSLGYIGARAAAHAPSPLELLIGTEGATLPLTLVLGGPGGEVAGSVLDPEGNPVPSASVRVGTPPYGGTGSGPVRAGAIALATDAQGRYHARGIEPGRAAVEVRAVGFAPWRGEVEVFGGALAALDARLQAGVTLSGNVVRADGEPVASAGIWLTKGGASHWAATTAGDGSFLLEDLEPGEIDVSAEGGEHGSAAATLAGAAGETLVWNAVLSRGGEITGRVVDDSGSPLVGWFVVADGEGSADGRWYSRDDTTDADGRFALEDLPDRPHRVEAFAPESGAFPALVAGGVLPGDGELLLRADPSRLPSVRIVGALVGSSGEPVANARLEPWSSAYRRSPIESPRADGGFELGPYPGGRWTLRIEVPGLPALVLGPRELAPEETWDCGTIQLQPAGHLLVHALPAAGLAADPPAFIVYQGGLRREELEGEGDSWRSGPLAPGDYHLEVQALATEEPGIARQWVPFAIPPGQTTALEVVYERGYPALVQVSAASGGERPFVRITDELGRSLAEGEPFHEAPGEYVLPLCLATGDYLVLASTSAGAHGSGALHVAPGSAPSTLRLDLR